MMCFKPRLIAAAKACSALHWCPIAFLFGPLMLFSRVYWLAGSCGEHRKGETAVSPPHMNMCDMWFGVRLIIIPVRTVKATFMSLGGVCSFPLCVACW